MIFKIAQWSLPGIMLFLLLANMVGFTISLDQIWPVFAMCFAVIWIAFEWTHRKDKKDRRVN